MATLQFTYCELLGDDHYWRLTSHEGLEDAEPALRWDLQEYMVVSGDIAIDAEPKLKAYRDDWEARGHTLVYIVEPFSGLNYPFNADQCDEGETPCVICGKPVKDDSGAKWLSVGDGNSRFLTPDEAKTAPDAGRWPVGPGCWRKHRAVLGQV